MSQGHYNRGDDTYYCDVGSGCGPFASLEAIREHIKTVHGYKRVTIADADQDPANQKVKDWEVGQVLALPDATVAGTVENFIPVTKLKDDRIKRFTIRVFMNSQDLQSKLMEYNLNLPPDTPMSVGALQLPPDDQPLSSLFGALRELQSQFVYFKHEIEHSLMALASIASYFREVFRTFPFIGFLSAERGWGKTTATKATVYSGYNGVFFTIPSEASFFRIVQDSGGSVGIDQIDDILADTQKNKDLLALLDGAHQKGTFVPRCEKDEGGKQIVIFYDPFSIVVFNGTELIPPSLLSRSIVITMTECAGRKKLKKNPIPADFQYVRDQLYLWRLRHWHQVEQTYNEFLEQGILLDRNEDIYLPLLTVAKLIDGELFDGVLEYAKKSYAQARAKRLNTWVQALVEMLPQFVGRAEIVEIRDRMNERLIEMGEKKLKKDGTPEKPLGSRWIVKNLNALGFDRTTRTPKSGRTRYLITKERIDELLIIYRDSLQDPLYPQNASQSSQSSQGLLEYTERVKMGEESEDTKGEESEAKKMSEKNGEGVRVPQNASSEECEESEAKKGKGKISVNNYEQPMALAKILEFIADLANVDHDHIAVIEKIQQRGQLAGFHPNFIAECVKELQRAGKISEVGPGRYRLV